MLDALALTARVIVFSGISDHAGMPEENRFFNIKRGEFMTNEILQELQEIRQLLALQQKKILTLDEFCSYAGISKSYAYHLTSEGKVKCYRPFGKMLYFNIDEVIEFLTQNPVNGSNGTKSKVNSYFTKQIIDKRS